MRLWDNVVTLPLPLLRQGRVLRSSSIGPSIGQYRHRLGPPLIYCTTTSCTIIIISSSSLQTLVTNTELPLLAHLIWTDRMTQGDGQRDTPHHYRLPAQIQLAGLVRMSEHYLRQCTSSMHRRAAVTFALA